MADISLTYDPQDYDITMYSFFSDLADARLSESDHSVGRRSVCIQNKWIYPLSGLVFNIDSETGKKQN